MLEVYEAEFTRFATFINIIGRVLRAKTSVQFSTAVLASNVTCTGGGCVVDADDIVFWHGTVARFWNVDAAGDGAVLRAGMVSLKSSVDAPSSLDCRRTSTSSSGGCVYVSGTFTAGTLANMTCSDTEAGVDGGCIYSDAGFMAGSNTSLTCSATSAMYGGCVFTNMDFMVREEARLDCSRTSAAYGGCVFAFGSFSTGQNVHTFCADTTATE